MDAQTLKAMFHEMYEYLLVCQGDDDRGPTDREVMLACLMLIAWHTAEIDRKTKDKEI